MLVICLLASVTSTQAIQDFRDAWRIKYPDSSADDIDGIEGAGGQGCQLCHQNLAGNEPWNQYGWDIREEYQRNGFDINQALDTVAFTDHDNDPVNAESFDEIIANFQPGWTAGSVNSVFMRDGTEIINQPPPALSANTALDFPAAIANPITATIATGAVALQLVEVAGDFRLPLRAVHAPGINGSIFVVEQTGKIIRVELATGAKTVFHDVSADLVDLSGGAGEMGLLGLAFHPDYQSNGLFYTYQSEPARPEQDAEVDFSTLGTQFSPNHRSMIVEYQADDPSCNSTITKQSTLMIIDQPQGNHNGGDLVFSAAGHLFISLGDGGGANDQGPGHSLTGTGRDNTNVLGSVLRINPLGSNSANGKYSVPGSNPFTAASDPGVDEIFAYGFRNPFRMSVDSLTGDLYLGDVGQNQIEEIDRVVSGGNYGWNWQEGSFNFYNPFGAGPYVSLTPSPRLPADVVAPIAEYDHDDGVSVIGGYMYRGTQLPSASGHYIFGELSHPGIPGSGRLLYIDPVSDEIKEFSTSSAVPGLVTGFGQDSDKELYVVTNTQFDPNATQGKLWRLADPANAPVYPDAGSESAACPGDEEFCLPIISSNGNTTLICL